MLRSVLKWTACAVPVLGFGIFLGALLFHAAESVWPAAVTPDECEAAVMAAAAETVPPEGLSERETICWLVSHGASPADSLMKLAPDTWARSRHTVTLTSDIVTTVALEDGKGRRLAVLIEDGTFDPAPDARPRRFTGTYEETHRAIAAAWARREESQSANPHSTG